MQAEASLAAYRKAEEDQNEGQYWDSIVHFSLSMLRDESYHPNAGYQIAWNLALLRRWDLAREALELVLEKHPLHEAGRQLSEIIAQLDQGDLAEATFHSPKELRKLIARKD